MPDKEKHHVAKKIKKIEWTLDNQDSFLYPVVITDKALAKLYILESALKKPFFRAKKDRVNVIGLKDSLIVELLGIISLFRDQVASVKKYHNRAFGDMPEGISKANYSKEQLYKYITNTVHGVTVEGTPVFQPVQVCGNCLRFIPLNDLGSDKPTEGECSAELLSEPDQCTRTMIDEKHSCMFDPVKWHLRIKFHESLARGVINKCPECGRYSWFVHDTDIDDLFEDLKGYCSYCGHAADVEEN